MPESPGIGASEELASLAESRGVVLFTSSKILGLAAVLGVGVVGDVGSAMFRLGGRKISFPNFDFV